MNKKNMQIKALILDMDGVLWKGEQAIVDLPKTFDLIRSRGFKFMLATNNSSKSPIEYTQKLAGFGVQVNEDQIINSSIAVAELMTNEFPKGCDVFVIGGNGLFDALKKKNFNSVAEKAQAVVAGLDLNFSYEKLKTATLMIRNGARFYGTNPDLTFPRPDGQHPGAGSILAAIEASSGAPPILAGKPLPFMLQFCMDKMGSSTENSIMIGDRLETDILGGQNIGCKTGLVLSGVSTMEQINGWDPKPDFITENLYTLIKSLPSI